MDKKAYVYLLTNKRNGTLYTGATTNLITRIYNHKNKLVKGFTSDYGLTQLVYFEVYDELELAFEREKRIKTWRRAWKLALIEKINPYWNDLYDSIL